MEGQWLPWLIPAVLLVLGILLYNGGRNYSFFGLIFMALAAVAVVYLLLGLLRVNHLMAAKLLTTVFTTLLGLGLMVATVTGVVIGAAARGNPGEECEYVIVLGAKVDGTEPSVTLRERIRAAYQYLAAHPNAIAVVSGGQGKDEGIAEADCMYRGLVELGMDPARIWMEDKSTSTWENLHFSLALIEEKTGSRPEQIGLVSSTYHLFRGRLFAKKWGAEAVAIPAKTGNPLHFLNAFLREIAGVWHYLILGG